MTKPLLSLITTGEVRMTDANATKSPWSNAECHRIGAATVLTPRPENPGSFICYRMTGRDTEMVDFRKVFSAFYRQNPTCRSEQHHASRP
jgi:hypothetical protein